MLAKYPTSENIRLVKIELYKAFRGNLFAGVKPNRDQGSISDDHNTTE